MTVLLPGATLGMLGGGQLGRMFTIAARTMGYNVVVLDPDPDSPAGELATDPVCADYQDPAALDYLAKTCAAVSTEFENVPAATLEQLARQCVVRPGARAVAITQDRIQELAPPALLKVSRFGYDGKGQAGIATADEAGRVWESLGREACVLEQRVSLDTEVSVVLARGEDGSMVTWPVAENSHRHGILDTTRVPARVPALIAEQAITTARDIAARLEYVGVLAVEFFVSHGRLLVNEIAPRPHNSGHYTLDACVTDQFEQQVRALCGLPLGDTRLLSPVVMVNLLGDLWRDGHAPPWEALLGRTNAKLHLYGKNQPRPGRKMGHYSVLAPVLDDAYAQALEIRQALMK